MSKKSIIILVSVGGLIILLAGVGGWYFYQQSQVLTPEKLLVSFENKDPNLTSENFQVFNQKFEETKARLQANADSFNDWLYLGVLKKGVGDYEGARDVFIYAGQIRPQSSTSFANLADLYAYFLNDPQQAEVNIKQAIVNEPNDYNFYLSLADIYRYKFPDGAAKYEQTMLEALAKFPDNTNLIAPLAGFYKQTGQTQQAIEYLEKLLKLMPDNQAVKAELVELKAQVK